MERLLVSTTNEENTWYLDPALSWENRLCDGASYSGRLLQYTDK